MPVTLRSRRLCAILIAIALPGCGEAPSVPVVVSAILVTGKPAVALDVGSSVQLAATPLNESGGTISNVRIVWTSSDPAVARVAANGLVTAVDGGRTTISAVAGGAEGKAEIDVRVSAQVGPSGGTLAMSNGRARLDVPPGSLLSTTTLFLAPAMVTNPLLIPGTAFEFSPASLWFGGATLTIGYDRARLPAGVSPTSLQLYAMTGPTTWTSVRGSRADTSTGVVSGMVSGTGVYGIMSTSVDRVGLSGAVAGGTLFVSQSSKLTATTYDAQNVILLGRVVRWESSDNAVVTVSETGTVTAMAVGTATITATSEGKSASTTVRVMTRPTADWSQATEWVTYQGNARHTGYVAVTADPVVFGEKWVVTPFGAGMLNPVTAAEGRVFVSTSAYFGTQQLAALDATSGATVWTKDFGGIHAVHPPAFGNGTVYATTSGHGDSFLWAFDAATGTLRFRSAYGNQWSRYYAPVVLDIAVYMAGGYYGGVYSFNATDGAQRWFASTNQYDEWSPAVDGGRVYAYTGSYAPAVGVYDAATGALVYSIADPTFSWSGWSMNLAPALGGVNQLFATNGGRLISFDLTARAIGWSQRASFTGSVTVTPTELYVVNSGQVDVRKVSDGSLVGTWVPPEGAVIPPLIVTKNLLFASTTSATYAVELTSLRQVWSYPAGGALALTKDGQLLIAQTTGKLSAITVR